MNGRRAEIGLGAYPATSLKTARIKADALRDAVAEGRDPLAEKRKAKEQPSFGEVAAEYIAAHKKSWRSASHL